MNGKKIWKMAAAGMCMALGISLCGCGGTQEAENIQKEQTYKFEPSLDTEKSVSLEIAGFMGNFEALDQVVNDFNQYYPNVTVSYEQNSGTELVNYLENNKYVDIFMTSDDNMRKKDDKAGYVYDYCVDLSKENLNTDVVDPLFLDECTVDGKLARIPLAKLECGMVVNETLLKKEGLSIPQNYGEFLKVCETLKEKGYTPIQGSRFHASSDLVLPMAMATIANDADLKKKINAADGSGTDKLQPVFEKLDELYSKGYINAEVNSTYPDDNYDEAILKFFEGDVPFWVCNTESVSGMKKRESKSEAFTANPFTYKFMYAPLSDQGVYDYEEPWYGFSVSKDSDNKDYAIEFLQFLMSGDELNKLAQVKGMPSVTKDSDDERYELVSHPKKVDMTYIYDGSIRSGVTSAVADISNNLGNGEIKSVEEAVKALQKRFEEL